MAIKAAQTYHLDALNTDGGDQDTLELTRMQGFVDGDDDIFDLLNKTKNRLLMNQNKYSKGCN